MENRKKIKFLSAYVILFYGITGLGYMFFDQKLENRKNFSIQNRMLYNLVMTDRDLCSGSIFGEAQQSDNSYFKVNFHCSPERSKYNTISLEAVETKTALGVVDEVSRIVQSKMPSDWKCFYERKVIEDMNMAIEWGRTIDCLAPGVSIEMIYSKP